MKEDRNDDCKWVIQLDGVYFRPEAQGYTNTIWRAGLFSREFADTYSHHSGIKISPLSDFVDFEMLNSMESHLKKMRLGIGKEIQTFDFTEKGYVSLLYKDGTTERMTKENMLKVVYENVRYFEGGVE